MRRCYIVANIERRASVKLVSRLVEGDLATHTTLHVHLVVLVETAMVRNQCLLNVSR